VNIDIVVQKTLLTLVYVGLIVHIIHVHIFSFWLQLLCFSKFSVQCSYCVIIRRWL